MGVCWKGQHVILETEVLEVPVTSTMLSLGTHWESQRTAGTSAAPWTGSSEEKLRGL